MSVGLFLAALISVYWLMHSWTEVRPSPVSIAVLLFAGGLSVWICEGYSALHVAEVTIVGLGLVEGLRRVLVAIDGRA